MVETFARPKPRVRLHMKPGTGHTLDGLLLSKRGDHYTLIDVSVVEDAERSHSAEGQWCVPKQNVHALQVLYT